MYYHQLPCIYHPQLNITNFCQDQQCLMPLCPSCIREHTDYHEEAQTKPSYFNIYEALTQTDTLITNSICNLEKDKKRNSELIFQINRLPAIIHEKIAQAKSIAYKILQQGFIDLERESLQLANKMNQELNMHSLKKSESYEQAIIRNLQELYDLVEGLKTNTCLADMIFYLKQKRFEVEDLHAQLSHYLYLNENYQTYVQLSKQAQQSLGVVISRMLKFDPKQKQKFFPQPPRGKGQAKNSYENVYHVALTPSKKKPLHTFEKGVRYSNQYLKSSPYRTYNQQQQRPRSPSNRETQQKRKQENTFRQINISERQRPQSKYEALQSKRGLYRAELAKMSKGY